ncbi:WD40 repeat domain-containing protein [Leptothoe spongobia]|uniref:WD40 repeat domain-containing protein n=1 Tax=Leptothoe spongobia TAU-MAC 1115 TaxID=1967444 RepID=A0A947DFQ0_9CYAN|nr:WD40 repeat domain-containing protein [Leptothoe spongobia]MBT9316070.1 WD40 repeat domain-containing protein [Leptothoe spongobia TAU-MAC 1115]
MLMPYKGLLPYDQEDSPIFFGRETLTEVIADNLMTSRLTIVYGESGVGKSSVLRAGVAHQIQQEEQQNSSNGIPEFTIVVFPPLEGQWSWRDDPIIGIQKQVESVIRQIVGKKNIEPVVPISSRLDQNLKAWTNYLGEEDENGEIFIVLDQFEDYFLYHAQKTGKGTFATEFPRAVKCRDLPVHFLISIRDDALAKLAFFKGRIPGLFGNLLKVDPLDYESAQDAVLKPIEEFNRQQRQSKVLVNVDKELAEEVLNQVKIGRVSLGERGRGLELMSESEPEPSPPNYEAPYLQLVMTRLWEKMEADESHNLQLSMLDDLGGAEIIVKAHFNEQMSLLSSKEQDIAADIFQYLVTPAGSTIAYPVLDLVGTTNCDEKDLTDLLDKLSRGNRRIIRPIGPSPEQRDVELYEIFHDVLAQPVLTWRTQHLKEKEFKEDLQQRQEKFDKERFNRISVIKQGLPAQSLRQNRRRNDELSALLARQAFLFNQRDQCQVLDQVDEALREILSLPDFSNILRGHSAAVHCVALTPDSRLLASGSEDQTVRLWNLEEPSFLAKTLKNHQGSVYAVAFSHDGKLLATGSEDSTVQLWNLTQFDKPRNILKDHNGSVYAVAFSPNSKLLATGSEDSTVRLWNLNQPNTPIAILKNHTDVVHSLAFSPDGKLLASGSSDKTIQLWSLTNLSIPLNVLSSQDGVYTLAFSPDGQLLAAGGWDGTVQLWDFSQLDKAPVKLKGHKGYIRSVAFMPNNSILASSGDDQTVRLWDLCRLSDKPKILRGQYFVISSVAFSRDAQLLVSGSWDSTIRLQKLQQAPLTPRVLKGHQLQISSVAFNRSKQLLASGSWDHTVRLWNTDDLHAEPKTLIGHQSEVNAVAFSPNSQLLASASSDKTVRLWELEQINSDARVFEGFDSGVSSVVFSPDSQILASGSWDRSIRLWDLRQPDTSCKILGHHDRSITSIAFSPDGKLLASGSDDKTVRLWHPEQTDFPLTVLQGHEGRILSVAFSPDGKLLASGSDDKTIRLWDLSQLGSTNTIPCKVLKGHSYWVSEIAFSPDGKMLASGGYDWTIRIWDLSGHNPRPILLKGHEQSVTSIAFSPDGKTLASGSYDATIRLWIACTQDLADAVCERVQRNLTHEEWQKYMSSYIPYERTCPTLPDSQDSTGS